MAAPSQGCQGQLLIQFPCGGRGRGAHVATVTPCKALASPGRGQGSLWGGLQEAAAEPLGSSDPLFDFFSVLVPDAPVFRSCAVPRFGSQRGFCLKETSTSPLLSPRFLAPEQGSGQQSGGAHPFKKHHWARGGCKRLGWVSRPPLPLKSPPVTPQPFKRNSQRPPCSSASQGIS